MKNNLKYFGISELEMQISILFKTGGVNSRLFTDDCTYNEVLSFLSSFFRIKRSEVRRILSPQGTLRLFRLLRYKNDNLQFDTTDFADGLLYEPLSKKEIMSRIARICPKNKLSCEDFAYMKRDLDMLLQYCNNSTNPSIFLYGKPGVGKNEIATLLAAAFKTTNDRKEIYLVSLVKSSKEIKK